MIRSTTLVLVAFFTLLTGCEQEFIKDWDEDQQDMTEAMGVAPDSLQNMSLAPLVKGYYEGEDLYFIHTEASDSSVANLLTEMMGPQVVHVPKLSETPDSLLANIYVFKNGVEGHGPFGFQPDVFGSVPGEEEYSPLRKIYLVQWESNAEPQELLTVKAIRQAEKKNQLSIEESDIVVNMPVLAWSGKHR